MALLWPINLLPPRDFAINPEFRNTRGSAAISGGARQIAASDAGRWKATLGNIRVKGSAARQAWRSLQVELEGGMGSVLIPLGGADQPFAAGGYGFLNPMPKDDEPFFAEDTGIAATVATPAPRRATQLVLSVSFAGTIRHGQHFSIGERLYRIKGHPAVNGSQVTVNIWPPLREAVGATNGVVFGSPICRMRLASDQEMDLDLLLRRSASPTVNFVEDL
ncbi:MAG: hypothetical protein DI629_12070 [Mesorhizobium amorphae]|nr:MAG: hypothetical protein DI629_12070 [Mesorhizobium amorphae]